MTRHYLGLQDASVLATRDLLLTGRAIADLIESEAMGAVVGPAGLGKTFAIEHALAGREEQVITLTFEARPTMRLVADRLLVAMTGAPGHGTGDRAERWPQVLRSHALRFRYDCWRELDPEQFARVEQRLFGCMTMLGGWCRSTDPSRSPEIAGAFRVLVEADDPELGYVRRCGARLALMTNQLPRLSATPLSLRPHPATAQEIDAVHAHTYPARAGYQLAKLITGLPDELLALISSDQITDYAVLGCPVPDAAWPILRAIEDRHEPVLEIPWTDPGEPREDITAQDNTTEMPPPVDRDFATVLGRLLHGRNVRIPCRDLSRPVRSRFETLRADGILERRYRVYRVSHVALYSSFRVDSAPDPRTDKRVIRSTATT